MKELSNLSAVFHNAPKESARRARRRWLILIAFGLWTIFVGFILSGLLANSGPTVWIVHDEGSSKPLQSGHAIFKADAGLQRLYPWMLFGPYVALLALYFPLERGRLRVSLPLNLAACGAFATTCHLINARTSLKTTNILFVASQSASGTAAAGPRTNTFQIEMIRGGAGGSFSEKIVKTLDSSNATNGGRSNIMGIAGEQEFASRDFTNLLAKLPPGIRSPLTPPALPGRTLWPTFLDLLMYCAIIGLTHSVHFYRRLRERERSALVLESNLSNARLSALRAQLHPHFLFNSLNAIATLLRRDPRLAEATLMSLSDLLRLALNQADRQEVPLREELNFVERYLEIQQTRFGDKLRVEQDIEPLALDCLVPALLLQPLVENAIRHGIEPAENAGLLRLTAHRNNGRLILTVEDNGVGLTTAFVDPPDTKALGVAAINVIAESDLPIASPVAVVRTNRGGIGLSNLRARLETLYGQSQTLELNSGAAGGVVVRVEIPWHSDGSLEPVAVSANS